jgi:hypothetical protein
MAKKPFSQEEIQDIKEYKEYLDDTIIKYKSLQEELKKYSKYVATGAREAIKAQLRDITEQLGTYKEITSELRKYDNLIKKIEKQESDIKNQTKERAQDTQTITDNLKEQNKELSEQEKRIKTLGEDWNDIDDLQTSISSEYGKQYGELGAIQKKIDGTKGIVSSISEVLKNDSKSYEDQLDKILEISERYKEFPVDFARMNKERKRGILTEKSMIDQLDDNLDEFDEMISKIRITNEETEQLVELFKKLRDEQAAFNDAQKVKYDTKEAAGELGNRFFGGAPVIGDALTTGGSVTNKLFSGETVAAASLIGAGYLSAKALAYLKAIEAANDGSKSVMETFIGLGRQYDTQIELFQNNMEIRKKQIELLGSEFNEAAGGSGFTRNFAIFDFDTEMMQLVTQFNKVSKTAFFGSGLGSVKYAKDQLELAGISADVIASTMSEMSMGANSAMQGLGEDVAVFSKKTGIASSQVAGLTGLFRMLDKTGGANAFKNLEESLSGVGLKGFNIADIAGELQNSSELALQYNKLNGAELVKQVKNVRDMGASYSKIAEAGKSMVLNYKDSISKEMELSAMLGENVDLSEARALFAAGKNDEAFGVLKSSGLLEKAQSQGLFAVQALQAAMGGMDLTQMAGQKYETGPKTGLTSNKEFLSAFQEAAKQQKIESAELDIKRAIIRMGDDSLGAGLIQAIGMDRQMTEYDLKITEQQIKKFLMVEGETAVEAGKGLFNTIMPMKMDPNSPLNPYKLNSKTFSSTPSDTATTKIQLVNSAAVVKPLEISNKSLKQIDTSSNVQTGLLQNLQTIMATMSNFTDPTFGLKLLIDGKDVKSRIEKIKTQEKGKTRN